MCWNCNGQHCCSFSHALVSCYVPACCTSTHAKCLLTDSRCSGFSQSNPFHCWNMSLGSWRNLPFHLYCGWQIEYTCSSTCTRQHVSVSVIRGGETQVSLSWKAQRIDIAQREREKNVTWSIMQAAHLNPSLPGTYTLRARIQPTCEWAPGHLSRWAWKSAASRPCMCINGGC